MYKIEKYKWEDRNRLYFSSDFHIFHNPSWPTPIWKMRGYESAEDAAFKTQKMINDVVPEDGVLHFMGDLALNATDGQVIDWLSGIKCKNIKLLWGNHESNTYRLYKQEVLRQFNRDDIEVYPLRIGNAAFVGNHLEIQVGKQIIVMNHFPLHSWNKMGRGSWMISGHQHLTDKTRHAGHPYGKTLDVGIDSGKIWSFSDIEDVMSTKTFVQVDHHDSNTN